IAATMNPTATAAIITNCQTRRAFSPCKKPPYPLTRCAVPECPGISHADPIFREALWDRFSRSDKIALAWRSHRYCGDADSARLLYRPPPIVGPLELSQTTNVPTRFRRVSDLGRLTNRFFLKDRCALPDQMSFSLARSWRALVLVKEDRRGANK